MEGRTIRKIPRMEVIELKRGKTLEQIIREQVEAGRTNDQIAEDLGLSYDTYRAWLRRLGARTVKTVTFKSEESHG